MKMAIPPKEQMTGSNTTEAQFKSGMNNIVDYLGDVDKQSLTFGTTAELKLAKPKIGQKAKTLDSGKVWEWKGAATGWFDTGEGELDRANEFTNTVAQSLSYQSSNTMQVAKDFYVNSTQLSKYFLDENMRIIELNKNSKKLDFHTLKTKSLSIIFINDKSQIVSSPSNNSDSELLLQLDAIQTSMLKTGESPRLYRDGEQIKQRQNDYPDYYYKSYDELDCTAEGMYAKYDALVAKFQCMTRNQIGSSVQGRPIYEYVVKPTIKRRPATHANTTPADWQVKPIKICVQACIHGNEYASTVGLYVFVQNLLRRWRELDGYGTLRFACEMHFVPCANPDGMKIKSRPNSNFVDLNRNFSHEWKATGSATENGMFSGESAASEPETQALETWSETNKDAVLFIDLHEHGQNELMWLGASTDSSFGIINELGDVITEFAFKHFDLASYASPESTSMVYVTKSQGGTAVAHYSKHIQSDSILIESAYTTHAMIRKNPLTLREYTAKSILESALIAYRKEQFNRNNGTFRN